MDEKDYHDLLIRIDERQATFSKSIDELVIELKKRPCAVNTEKIKTLEKVTWTAVMVAIVAAVKSFWSLFTGP